MAALLAYQPAAPALAESGNGDPAREFLARHLDVSPAEFRRIDRGEVAATSLEAEDRREVASRGVVRIRVDADTYLERLADIVSFKRHEAVQQIGVFSHVPTAADLRGLTLDRGDVRNLRSCRVGDCDLNLPAEAIERLQREVRWATPEAEEQANAVLRDVLARYVAAYRWHGGKAGMQYANDREPVSVTAEFEALLATDSLLKQFPALVSYARRYPAERGSAIDELIYWSREKPGPSPVISITHMMMFRVGDGTRASPVRHAVMSRQIYGSRYFDASLGLTLLLPDLASEAPATYVVYWNRSRLDAFSGIFGGLIRRTVRSRVRSGMADSLARVKAAMERGGAAEVR